MYRMNKPNMFPWIAKKDDHLTLVQIPPLLTRSQRRKDFYDRGEREQ
jgi:hypothetical protein